MSIAQAWVAAYILGLPQGLKMAVKIVLLRKGFSYFIKCQFNVKANWKWTYSYQSVTAIHNIFLSVWRYLERILFTKCFPANTKQYHKHNFNLQKNYNISVCKGRHCEKLPSNLGRNYQKIKSKVKKQITC